MDVDRPPQRTTASSVTAAATPYSSSSLSSSSSVTRPQRTTSSVTAAAIPSSSSSSSLDVRSATALTVALAAGDHASIAANIDAANEIVTHISTPGNGRVVAASEIERCFDNAQDFTALLQELLANEPVSNSSSSGASIAGQDQAHEHPRLLSLPSAEDWSSHSFRITLIGRQIASYCRDNATLIHKLAPPPDVLDSAHVKHMLCTAYGSLPSCSMADACMGCMKPGGFVLMRYFSPAEWQHFRITGQHVASMEQRGLCYLCLLALTNVAMSTAMTNAAQVESVQPPFCHYVDAPGGYTREALHFSANSATSSGISHLVRRLNMNDYVIEERMVCETQGTDTRDNSTIWQWKNAKALSERAELLHNVPALPAKGLLVGSAPMLSCEQLLGAELVQRSTLQPLQLKDALQSLEEFVTSHALNTAGQYVPVATPFGCDVPQELHVLSSSVYNAADRNGAQIRAALCFCGFAEARLRLVHLLSVSGSVSDAVLRGARCMASQFQHWNPPARLCRAESVKVIVTHSVLFLLLLRIDEIASRLHSGSANFSLARKLQEYRDALQAMLQHYVQLADTGQPVNDRVLFVQADPQSIVPYAALHPRPRPVYFAPADLLCAAASPSCNKAPGVPKQPPLIYLSSVVADHLFPTQYLRDAWAARTITLSPSLLPALYWVRDRIDRQNMPALHVPVALPGQNIDAGWSALVNARLRNALGTGAPNCTVWHTLAMRIELLRTAIAALQPYSTCRTDEFYTRAGPALASAINAALEHDGTIRVVQLADVLCQFQRLEEERNHEDADARDYAKRLMVAHIALCAELLSAGLITDAECQPVVDVNLYMDVGVALPLNDALASQLDSAPSLDTPSGVPSPALSALSDAIPSPTVRTNELERCISDACTENTQFVQLMGQLAHATLGGYYRRSTHMPEPSRLLELYLALIWPQDPNAIRAALASLAASDHGVQAMLARQYVAALIDCCPALRLRLENHYTNTAGWMDVVAAQGDALARWFPGFALVRARDHNARPSRDGWPAAGKISARLSMQRAFVLRVASACHEVDRRVAADTSLAMRAPVTHSQVAPPRETLLLVDRYVSELKRFAPSSECIRHLRELGVSEQCVAQVQRLHVEASNGVLTDSTAEHVLEDVALCSPVDYALISLFFRLSALHRHRRIVRLDADVTRRQLRAVATLDRCYAPHLHCAVLSSVLCCDRICNFIAQTAPTFSGLLNTRTNPETGEMVCVCKREKHQLLDAPSSAEIRDTLKEATAAIKEYWRIAENCDATDEESRNAHAELVRRKRIDALDKAGTHGSNVQKSAHQLQCGNPLTLVCMLGASVEHHGTSAPHSRPSSCTLCPRCGRKTAFAPALIGACGFTCGNCDREQRNKILEQYVQEPRCCICNEARDNALKASRQGGQFARFTKHEGIDDCSVDGAAIACDLWLCSMCFKSWIREALQDHMTLNEVRKLLAITRETPLRLDELTYSSHDTAMLGALRAFAERPSLKADAVPLYPDEALVVQRSIEVRVGDAPVDAVAHTQRLDNAKRIRVMRRKAETLKKREENKKRERLLLHKK